MNSKIFNLIKKILLVIIPVFVLFIILIATYSMHFFDKEYAWYKENKEYAYNNNDEYVRILFMGDSLSKCNYMPKYLANDSYNYALGGASVAEEYFYLKEYLENNDAPKYIFYSTDPSRFMKFDTLWTRSVYFHRLDKDDLISLIDKAEEFNNLNEIGIDKIKEIYQYYYYLPTKYSVAIMNGIIMPSRFLENTKKYNEVINNKGETQFNSAKYCNEKSNLVNYTNFVALPVLDFYFKEFLNICLENNITLIFEPGPINEATYNSLNDVFIEEYSQYLKKIKKDYSNFILNTEFLCYGGECFGDATHLNDAGIIKYNKYIKNKYLDIFEGD